MGANISMKDTCLFALFDRFRDELIPPELDHIEQQWEEKYGIKIRKYHQWLQKRPMWLHHVATRIEKHPTGKELWRVDGNSLGYPRSYFTIIPSEKQITAERIAQRAII